ncbi:MAG: transposase [candidate division Zixibacteria bacterium]|nr:transposase [candidate division Zixibacteria bacterium]
MSTRTRLEYSGPCLVFVTTTVKDWTPVFRDKALAEIVLDQFRSAILHYEASCIAYVLIMPSYLHVALGFKEYQIVRKFMQSLKILSSKRLRPMLPNVLRTHFEQNGKYGFWMPRYDELVISTEKQFRVKLDYIHNNPVRGNLVDAPEDWPYSSAGDWLSDRPGVIPIDKDFRYLIE